MLKKENRLSTNFEFRITKKHGNHYEGKYSHIYILKPHNYVGPPKFGIVVSNRFHKSAVKRNRVKRVFREIIRLNIDKFKDNNWIVLYPKKNVLNKPYEKINTDFNKTVQKIFVSG